MNSFILKNEEPYYMNGKDFQIDRQIRVGGAEISLLHPPKDMVLDEALGLITANNNITGQIIYTATDMLLKLAQLLLPKEIIC